MQPIIWKVQYNDGTQSVEFDENNIETSFTKILPRKSEFTHIALLDTVNKIKYTINLKNGEFIFNGLPINIGKEIDGRTFNFSNISGVKYNEGVIQYKCSNPVTVGNNTSVTAATYNIGYKIELSDFKYERYSKKGITWYYVTHCQPMISIDARTMKATVTITLTVKIVDPKGNEKTVKL